MRLIVTLACAGVIVAAAAAQHARAQGGQPQVGLKDCLQVKNDADRLRCYDRLATGTPGESNPAGGAAWDVTDQRSPLDDSPLITATMPSADGRANLLLRCKDRRTDVAIAIRGFTKCGGDVRVVYRLDQNPSTDAPWKSSSTCYLAISPQPIPFIRALTDQSKVFFRLYDHHDAAHDAEFNLGKVSEIRSRLADACDWDGASKGSGKPGAAPAVGGAPKAAPK